MKFKISLTSNQQSVTPSTKVLNIAQIHFMDLSEHAVDEEQDRYENILARSNNDGTDSSKITKMGTI